MTFFIFITSRNAISIFDTMLFDPVTKVICILNLDEYVTWLLFKDKGQNLQYHVKYILVLQCLVVLQVTLSKTKTLDLMFLCYLPNNSFEFLEEH